MTNRKVPEEILVIEDSPTQAERLKFVLERHGYQVSTARNGLEALDLLAKRRPQLIISDILMPEINGYEFCRRLRGNQDLEQIPVILLTALSDPADVMRALECGADSFIIKPYEDAHLLQRIELFSRNQDLGPREEVQAALETVFKGQKYFINAGRLQILNLLLSTYEAAVEKNAKLLKAQEELAALTEELEAQSEELRVQNEELRSLAKELELERARLETVLEEMPAGVIIAEAPSGRLLRSNQEMARIWRYSFLASAAIAADHEEQGFQQVGRSYAPIEWPISRSITTGEVVRDEEIEVLRGDGTRGVISVSSAPIRGRLGNIVAGVMASLDITARKEGEEALKRSNKRIIDILESISDGFLSMDREMVVTYVNPAAGRLWGRDRSEVLGRSLFDAFPGSRESVFGQKYLEALREKKFIALEAYYDVEPYQNWYDVRIFPYEGGISVYFQVTTARKQVEEAQRRAREEWERTFDAVPDLIAILDDRHRIVRVNRAMAGALGRAAADLVGRPCYECMHNSPGPPPFCPHSQLLDDGREHAAEVHELGRDFLVTASPLRDAQGRLSGSVHVARDITERKQAEAALRRAHDGLEERVLARTAALAAANAVLAGINRIFRGALTCETEEELGRTSLAVVAELTGAEFGFIDELNPAGCLDFSALSDPGRVTCRLAATGGLILPEQFEARSLYQRALNDGKPFLANQTASHPDHIGLLKGQPPLTAFLGVPLKYGDQVIGLLGLANKAGGFHQANQEAAESLAVAIVEALMRFRAEKQAETAGRLYRFLSKVNEAIVRDYDQESLLRQVCRIAVQEGLFRLAWIGLIDPLSRSLQVAAKYGFDEGYLEDLIIPLEDVPEGRGPTGIAVREGRFDVCNDYASDPRMAPWRAQALERGYRAAAAFPLRVEARVVGALTLYSGKPGFFTEDEIALLESLAGDLSFALESMDREVKRRQAEKSLKESGERLRHLTSQLLSAQETERKRISRELHDDLGQSLLVLKLQLRAVEKKLPPELSETKDELEISLDHINKVIDNVRRLSRDLRPAILEDLGLAAALQHLFEEFSKYQEIQLTLDLDDIPGLFAPAAQIIIYRIFQESLTNVAKHAQASRVSVSIKKQDGEVAFRVEDNGRGFDLQKIRARDLTGGGLGLTAMDERIRILGGSLDIRSRVGRGTIISFVVPLPGK